VWVWLSAALLARVASGAAFLILGEGREGNKPGNPPAGIGDELLHITEINAQEQHYEHKYPHTYQ
jgi:hypothetical protein